MDFKRAMKELYENSSSLFAIHYSCQNLSDSNEGYSPRITSIAVLHIEHSVMHSFSIHLIAEEQHVDREKIETEYDSLEGEMLSRFYAFVADNPDARWLHWNMSNINYGFETLSHRYRVLTGKDATRIADTRRYNLSALITSKYGNECVNDPKMVNLMVLNGGKHRDFLNGKEEVESFHAKEFLKLHKSTMSKTYWFQKIYLRLLDNKIKIHRSNWKEKANRLVESLPAKILGLVSVLFTIWQLMYLGIENFKSNYSSVPSVEEQRKT